MKTFKRKMLRELILLKLSANINQIRGQNERKTGICSSFFFPSLPEEIVVSHNMELKPVAVRSREISDTRDTSSKQLSTSSTEQLQL